MISSNHSVSSRSVRECWICYDTERSDAGPLIKPCACKGDVGVVHHECLRQWLMESYSNPESVKCKVCKETYKVQKGEIWLPSGLTISHWFQTAAVTSIMCIAIVGAYLIIRWFDHVYIRTVSVGCAILVEYICLRLLGFSILSAYQRAKFLAVKIKGRKLEDLEGDTYSCLAQTPLTTVLEPGHIPDAFETTVPETALPIDIEDQIASTSNDGCH